MMSSLMMSAVNEIETMFKNSFSKSTKDMIIIAAPVIISRMSVAKRSRHYLDTD